MHIQRPTLARQPVHQRPAEGIDPQRAIQRHDGNGLERPTAFCACRNILPQAIGDAGGKLQYQRRIAAGHLLEGSTIDANQQAVADCAHARAASMAGQQSDFAHAFAGHHFAEQRGALRGVRVIGGAQDLQSTANQEIQRIAGLTLPEQPVATRQFDRSPAYPATPVRPPG